MEEKKIPVIHLQMVKDGEVPCNGRKMENPQEAAELVRDFLGDIDRECLVVCATDTKMKPTYIQTVGVGTENLCPVSMPGIFKAAMLSNATNIILFHNHTSGDVLASREDIQLTKRIKESGELLGVRLQDHMIIGNNGLYYSFREQGVCFRKV